MSVLLNIFANKSPLGRKITLLVSLIAVFVFSGMLVARVLQERADAMTDLNDSSLRETGFIKTIIDRPMNAGDNVGTAREFAFFAKEYPFIDMYMLSFIGEISYSTKPEAVRKQVDAVSLPPELVAVAQKALKQELNTSMLLADGKTHRFARVMSITNEAKCYHCHGSSQPILGELIVIRDVTSMFNRLDFNMITSVGISVFGLLALLLALTVFVYFVISRRLLILTSASNAVVEGNLNTVFEVGGKDELSVLAQNLSSMVGHIKKDIGFSRGILNGLTVPFVVVDMQGNITACNDAMLTCCGHSGNPDDYKGQNAGDFLLLDGHKNTLLFKAMNENAAQLGHELSFTNKKGARKHLLMDAVPLKDLDNTLIGAFALYTDLTEVREQQEVLAEQNKRIAEASRSASAIAHDLSQASNILSEQVASAHTDADATLDHAHESVLASSQMLAAAQSVAESASETAKLADVARNEANQGGDVVQQAVACIGEVMEQVRTVVAHMESLSTQADSITRIISVIDEIADQTNLLALNAAIEAARAGDAGRGFAVVADEVRKLAEKTQEATRHVGSSIKTILSSIADGTKGTDHALQLVESATGYARQSGEALGRIQRVVEQTASNINTIASAAQEQSVSSAEMSRGADSINSVASNTADTMQKAAQAVAALNATAHKLDAVIESMRSE